MRCRARCWRDERERQRGVVLASFEIVERRIAGAVERERKAVKRAPTTREEGAHVSNIGTCAENAIGKEKRPDKHHLSGLYILVPEIGVEPTTFALRMRCSTN
ncbi:hypothetical protein BLAT2472_10140 [Burkholderia latens]